MNKSTLAQLTKYKVGSYRELFTVAIPLLFSYFAATLMIFADRAILAQYSLEAMNAASIVGTIAFVMEYFLMNIAMFSGVLVGKLNGAKKYSQAAKPTWQMVWMSLASSIPFILVALTCAKFLIPQNYYQLGEPYFRILLYFGCFTVLNAALGAFFVAIGNTKIIIIGAVVGNIVNVVTDFALIFGVEGYIPEMGIRGAAIGSNCGITSQAIVLFAFFMRKQFREKYNSHSPSWCLNTVKHCFKLGLPTSFGFTLELSAWAFGFYFLPSVGILHTTIFTIGHTIFIPLTSISDSIKRSVIAIISNCIGANATTYNRKVIKTAFVVYTFFTAATIVLLLYLSPQIIDLFLLDDANKALITEFYSHSHLIIATIMLFIAVQGFGWIVSGYLIAREFAIFIMLVTAVTAWVTSILPMYILFKYFNWHYMWMWIFLSIYPTITGLIFGYKAHRLLESD